MDYSRVHRLLKVLTLIQAGGGWNAARLAEACGTTERTIYRDLNMLEGAGIPYFFDDETRTYRIRRDFFMPPVELTLEEALALICLTDRIADGEQIPFMKPASRAVAKLRGRLPATIRDALEQVDPHIEVRLAAAMPSDGVVDVYELVRQAIAKRRELVCAYEPVRSHLKDGSIDETEKDPQVDGQSHATSAGDSASGPTFTFRPYCLFFGQRAWYTIGARSDRDEPRCLKLSRFARMEPTETPYMLPDDFSLTAYLGKAWRMIRGRREYQVELHFDAHFAETIADTHWHATQEVEWLDDGSILFRCEVDGLDEIVWWILSMGPHCTVRQPDELARRVRELAEATAQRYA